MGDINGSCCSISSEMSGWSDSCPVPCQPCMCQATFSIEDTVNDTFVNMTVSLWVHSIGSFLVANQLLTGNPRTTDKFLNGTLTDGLRVCHLPHLPKHSSLPCCLKFIDAPTTQRSFRARCFSAGGWPTSRPNAFLWAPVVGRRISQWNAASVSVIMSVNCLQWTVVHCPVRLATSLKSS